MPDIEERSSLTAYLAGRPESPARTQFQHRVLAGGVSSKTVLVTFVDGTRWVLKQSLEKLRVPGEWLSDPARIHREAQGMQILGELAPPGSITRLIFDDADHHIIAMTAAPEPHDNLKALLLAGDIRPGVFDELGKLLGDIHSRSAHHPDRYSSLDQRYFKTLRVDPYYRAAAENEPRAAAFIEALISAMSRRHLALVHGDFSPKNILIHNHHPILLDHEVLHWGDPAFDLGFFLTHLLSKWNHCPRHRDRLMECVNGFSAAYFAAVGEVAGLELMAVRHTAACSLARVAGQSQLEYLTQSEKARQREAICGLIQHPLPPTIAEWSRAFAAAVSTGET